MDWTSVDPCNNAVAHSSEACFIDCNLGSKAEASRHNAVQLSHSQGRSLYWNDLEDWSQQFLCCRDFAPVNSQIALLVGADDFDLASETRQISRQGQVQIPCSPLRRKYQAPEIPVD